MREGYLSINEVRFYEVVRRYGQHTVRVLNRLGRRKLGRALHIISFCLFRRSLGYVNRNAAFEKINQKSIDPGSPQPKPYLFLLVTLARIDRLRWP